VQQRELRLQVCASCARPWFPPGPVCPTCLGDDWRFERMSGRGRVVAWTVFHRQYFKELPVPYAVVSVELDEGPLLVGNLPGVDPAAIRLDRPVRVTFEPVAAADGEWLIYEWQPV
jgi:uncharacterized OB-fold protein